GADQHVRPAVVVRRLEEDVAAGLEQERLLLAVAAHDDRVGVRAQRGEELSAHLQSRPSVGRRLLELRQLSRERDEAGPVDHGAGIPSGVMSERYAARDAGFEARSHTEPALPEK